MIDVGISATRCINFTLLLSINIVTVMPDIPAISQCKWSLTQPSYSQLADGADESLLRRIMTDDGHVLQPLLPDRPAIPYTYSLRERSHNKTLLNKATHLNDDGFLIRML